ncbi:MAG: DNA alkylation repair protein [Candidatus Omnitrophica bacterium]|nr:DNA alkylation repair protein [Candidatus Omnitrophota bacterium]
MIAFVRRELKRYAGAQKKKRLQSFFKTGPGEYGEGDVFIGVTVPECRKTALTCAEMSRNDIEALLYSKVHEERLVALLILVERFKQGSASEKKSIFDFYLKHACRVNNWDLVDLTADKIVGAFLLDRSKSPLYRLARSSYLWERRISIVATLHFIRAGHFEDTLELVEKLMGDTQDLLHKACGWMLREVGKRDAAVLEQFLKKHCLSMPRTMLRYSIERLSTAKKKMYLCGNVKP